MSTSLTWNEICRIYPDEWVVVVNYQNKGPVEVDGVVVAHGPDRSQFKDQIVKAMQEHGQTAVRYTGELIQESELPLLWQIFPTN